MRDMTKYLRPLVLLAFLTGPIVACDFDQGPAEEAGEEVDEAVNDMKRGVEDATD